MEMISVSVVIEGRPTTIEIPIEVVNVARSGLYDPGGQRIDEAPGYALVDMKVQEEPCGRECCGVFVEWVSISTPEGVKIKVFESDGLNKYPVEQVLDEENDL